MQVGNEKKIVDLTNDGAALPNPAPGQRMPAPGHGVYGITVAAELSGAPTQSLRLWERHGLLSPARSEGGTRRYSADDLARIERIVTLVAAGVNIAGIGRILDLQDQNGDLQDQNSQLASDNSALERRNAALQAGQQTPLPTRTPRSSRRSGARNTDRHT